MTYLIRTHRTNISLVDVESTLGKVMKSIDLTELTNNPNSYRKLFALGYVIKHGLHQSKVESHQRDKSRGFCIIDSGHQPTHLPIAPKETGDFAIVSAVE